MCLNLSRLITNIRNRYLFIMDIIAFLFTPFLAMALRLDGFAEVGKYLPALWVYMILSVGAKIGVNYTLGMYRRFWRYASVEELLLILKAASIASLLMMGLVFAVDSRYTSLYLPRSLPIIDFLLTLGAIALPRFSFRLWMTSSMPDVGHRTRVAIFGAGEAGQLLAREIEADTRLRYQVVGFFDDDVRKAGLRLRGYPIFGGRDKLVQVVRERNIQEVIIAIPSASGRVIREIVHACQRAGVETRILPALAEILRTHVTVDRLRRVELEDLLRREPVRIDMDKVGQFIRGKRVLVTGAGGSIGAELCRQVWHFGPSQLILLGHGENSLFSIYQELRGHGPGVDALSGRGDLIPVVADIRFLDRLEDIFHRYRPDIVFHAAAHKHVPLMEMNPVEAITNNVMGTHHLLTAARSAGVEHVVLISTDKAVHPTSMMGASKRVAEYLLLQAARESKNPYVVVRFGNVLGSRGSVVEVFQRQIAAGGPVTITHPEVKRYFMTIPEAVQLVLQAALLGQGGEVFVLDMGEPVKIVDLARDMIELSGLRVGEDIEITFTGLRPGEKLAETLFVSGEEYRRTSHEKIFVVTNADAFVPHTLEEDYTRLITAVAENDEEEMRLILTRLVPEFHPGFALERRRVSVKNSTLSTME